MNGPCAKQVVTATVIAPDGRRFVGTNECRTAQKTCPRGDMPTGVGYELCRSVCGQEQHAEVMALRAAGDASIGAKLFVEGHTYVCLNCKMAAHTAAIAEIVIGAPDA